MEEQISPITHFVNHYFGQFALAILHALHITPDNAQLPIPEHVAMGLLVLLIGTGLALILKSRLSVERPGAMQQTAEMLLTNPLGFGIRDLLEENAGHDGLSYIPFVGSISIFILLSNLLSVFPKLSAPTSNLTVPLACAILTFLYFNWQGIRHQGLGGYLKHFAGPEPMLAFLIFPVEIFSTCARVLSLTVRLWANIFASDLIYGIFLSLLSAAAASVWEHSLAGGLVVGIFAATIPVAFIGLHIFVAVIQSYIFTILPSVYLGMATAQEH
jgi:F-type H+-transporting ATPase subunit a